MNRYLKYAMIVAGLVAAILFVRFFFNFTASVAMAVVLSLPGKKFVHFVTRFGYKKIRISHGIAAVLFLLLVWSIAALVFIIFVPVIISEITRFSTFDPVAFSAYLNSWLGELSKWAEHYNISLSEITSYISAKMSGIFSFSWFTAALTSAFSVLGNVLVAFFTFSFFLFFMCKEDYRSEDFLILLVPGEYVEKMREAFASIKTILTGYFIGIGIELLILFCAITLGLWFVGVPLRLALVAAFLAAIMNVIPYVGPIIGDVFGLFIGMICVVNGYYPGSLLHLEILILVVLFSSQIIDMVILQPWLYGEKIKAHPLEIFSVIIIAGKLGGVLAMIIALPTYTVIRVIAHEFFNQFELVKKFTKEI